MLPGLPTSLPSTRPPTAPCCDDGYRSGSSAMEITKEHVLIGIVALAAIGFIILLIRGDDDE